MFSNYQRRRSGVVITREDAECRVLMEFSTRPTQKSLDWFVDGYMRIHCKPVEDVKKKPEQLKLF